MKPQTETVFTGEDAIKMQKIIDALENLNLIYQCDHRRIRLRCS